MKGEEDHENTQIMVVPPLFMLQPVTIVCRSV
jgi:hypothetical protein